TQLLFQPSSTRIPCQPCACAKSTYCRWRFASPGLPGSVSQDQATLPGLIQLVSGTLDGAARSSVSREVVTVARSPTIAARHGVAAGEDLPVRDAIGGRPDRNVKPAAAGAGERQRRLR